GRWEELLAEKAPPAGMPYVTGVWRYTRGLAFSATGRPAEAARELAELEATRQVVAPERSVAGFFKTAEMLRLAAEALAAEIAAPLGACRGNARARAMRRVQRRGGARGPHARRTPCTLSVRPRAPTKPMGPSHRSRLAFEGPSPPARGRGQGEGGASEACV